MAFLILLCIVGIAIAEDCIENSNTVVVYGDSRTDTRSPQNIRDWWGGEKVYFDAKSSSGIINVFLATQIGDNFQPWGRKRVIYDGVNACNIHPAMFDSTMTTLTKAEVFQRAYDAFLNRKFHWAPPVIGTSIFMKTVISNMNFVNRQMLQATAATDVYIEAAEAESLYMVCHDGVTAGTANVGGSNYNINTGPHCGWHKGGIGITGFVGKLYVSDVLHIGDIIGQGLLLRSYSDTAICSELAAVWTTQGAWDTPNDAGLYPGDGSGLAPGHGSIRIRNQFKTWLGCENVDWSQYDGYCTNCKKLPVIDYASFASLDMLNQTKTEVSGLLQGSGVLTLKDQIDTAKTEVRNELNQTLRAFQGQVEEKATQLGYFGWVGVAGTAMAFISLIIVIAMVGVKIHAARTSGSLMCCGV